MDLKDKRVLVVGLGKTGEALCDFLLKSGARVTVSEKKTDAEMGGRPEEWRRKGIDVRTDGHRPSTFLSQDMIVTSPGVPYHEAFLVAKEKNIPILPEIELAGRYLKGRIVGITGSNGKSTTTSLIHAILKHGGLKSFLAGNIGTPLISFVESSREDHIYVTELSSFQLALIQDFRAETAVFLNVSPDHLDWHGSLIEYVKSKIRLLQTQSPEDTAILNRDDPEVWEARGATRGRVIPFSRRVAVSEGAFIESGWIVFSGTHPEKLMKIEDIPLLGSHNQENVLAAALAGRRFGVSSQDIRAAVLSFPGLPHRLEYVNTIRGVEFYNDSKATNVDASLKSIDSFIRPLILILGGRDKNSDFSRLRTPVSEKAKGLVLLGEAREKIAAALQGTVPSVTAYSVEEAARKAFEMAETGDIVLLAPACTSWDMFRNFEERGDTFKSEVEAMKQEIEAR